MLLSSSSAPITSETCESIVHLILAGDPKGEELLYSHFVRGLRYLAAKHCPEYAEDCAQDTLITAARQIREGKLQIAAALPGYLTIVVKRTAWSKKTETERVGADQKVFTTVMQTRADNGHNPERLLEIKERSAILREGLESLKPQEREILIRFYLKGERPEEICHQMRFTETQFRFNKSRSKSKLEAFTIRRMKKRVLRMDALTALPGPA